VWGIKLNSNKKQDFIISNSIVVCFIVLIVLVVNYMLISLFGFNQQNFTAITVVLLLLGVGLYIFLSKSLLDPLFKSDEQIQSRIKETLHELNTPVATIQMNVKMLSKTAEDEKTLKRLNRIEQSCQNLLKLYLQMEYDIKKEVDLVELDQFNLKDVVESSVANFDDIKNDIKIINDISGDLIINSDKSGFEKVINNLISNSIKYNKPNGYVKISLKKNILVIEDSGIGIDTQNLFKVFDKYYQQDSLNSGVGLGLNIVKEFCDKHKIKINIESNPNKGTVFFLNLDRIMIT
jgi:signal transduction histidine kinase